MMIVLSIGLIFVISICGLALDMDLVFCFLPFIPFIILFSMVFINEDEMKIHEKNIPIMALNNTSKVEG